MADLDVIILAGGYARRLSPITDYTPKPLLHVGGVPLLYFVIRNVLEINPNKIIISTNKRFENDFRWFLKTLPSFFPISLLDKILLVIEPSKREEEKLGAIGGLYYAINKLSLYNSNLLIILGDNLFDGFDLNEIVFLGHRTNKITIASCDIKNLEEAKKYGILEVEWDNNLKSYVIKNFEEKPEKPKSTLVSIGIYYIPKEKIKTIRDYIEEGNNKDAIGKFFEYLIKRGEKILTYIYENGYWIDIGTLKTYEEANRYVIEKGLNQRFIWP